MTRKMSSPEIAHLLHALIDSPRWSGSTEEDRQSVTDIDVWGDIAWVAFNELTSAFASARDVKGPNASAIEIRDAVREQLDALKEVLSDYD
jgi:hypothetical protein